MKRVVSILTTVVMSIVLLVLLFVFVRLLTDSKASTSFDRLSDSSPVEVLDEWDFEEDNGVELVEDSHEGDVVTVQGYNFRVPGNLFEVPPASARNFNYCSSNDGLTKSVNYNQSSNIDNLLTDLEDYFNGDVEAIQTYIPVNTQSENLTCYRQDTNDGSLAIVYNNANSHYYMFVPLTEVYLCIDSEEMLYFTTDTRTVIFGDPAKDPMTYHTYSMYETTAMQNTINQLTDGEYDVDLSQLPTEVDAGSTTYTSEADNETRRQMLQYSSFDWNEDGTSSGTSMVIDTTSETAKASEWILTSSSAYSFTNNSIKLHSLRAARNTETFSVEGKVTNQLSYERPYVLVIKFLNSEHGLLGVGVVDKRSEPIEPSNVADWEYVLSSDSGIDLQAITALQFEVY